MSDYISKVTVPEGDSTHTYDVKEIFPHYGVCSTAAGTAAKEVSINNFTLYTGAWVVVKFNTTNTAAVGSLTLNVNSTGAKNIKYRNANLGWTGYLAANTHYLFMYDGTYWQVTGDINTNTYDRTSHQTRIYAGGVGAFLYSILGLNTDQRMESFTTTGGTGTSKAFNTSGKFLYPPVIMYHSSGSTVAAGSVIANNVLYEQFPAINLTYNSNKTSSSGFAQYKPLYIECTFDDTGSYWSPTSTGLTQTFTSGRYYVLLGCMYNTSVIELALFAQHPVYYYDGTNLVSVDWDRANTSTATIGSASTGQVIPADDITAWNAGTLPSLTTTTYTVPNVTGNSSVTIPNVTGNTSVTIPNVTGNTSVTVKSVKTVDTPTTAKISSGVLTFTKGTAVVTEDKTTTNTTLGTNLTASKVTLGTALSASKVTLGTAFSIKGVNEWGTGTLPSLTYTAKSIPNISVTSVTNVLKKK